MKPAYRNNEVREQDASLCEFDTQLGKLGGFQTGTLYHAKNSGSSSKAARN